MLALLGPLGTTELIVIGLFMLLFFGRKLPDVGRNLGRGIVEFKKGLVGDRDESTAKPPVESPVTTKFRAEARTREGDHSL